MAHLAGPARLEPLELLVGLAGLVGLSLNAAISVSILTCSAKT
jgi:hypothetical protein